MEKKMEKLFVMRSDRDRRTGVDRRKSKRLWPHERRLQREPRAEYARLREWSSVLIGVKI